MYPNATYNAYTKFDTNTLIEHTQLWWYTNYCTVNITTTITLTMCNILQNKCWITKVSTCNTTHLMDQASINHIIMFIRTGECVKIFSPPLKSLWFKITDHLSQYTQYLQ